MNRKTVWLPFLTLALAPSLALSADVRVEWAPWEASAFEQAAAQSSLIFLSIAPEWSHLSNWQDQRTFTAVGDSREAAIIPLINRGFTRIRVDPDQRPDVDLRYQALATMLFGESGWPLNCITLADGLPVYTGTILGGVTATSSDRIEVVVEEMRSTYDPTAVSDSDPNATAERARRIAAQTEFRNAKVGPFLDQLIHYQEGAGGESLPASESLDRFADALRQRFDAQHGGFPMTNARYPKMVNAASIRLALTLEKNRSRSEMREIAVRSLDAVLDGGVHDKVNGGFHHYAADREWRSPRFEKLLPVNADMLLALTDAYLATGDERYRLAASQTAGFIQRTLRLPGGTFASGQNADLLGVLREETLNVNAAPDRGASTVTIRQIDNGSYYTWSLEELEGILTEEERQFMAAHYGLTIAGGVEGLVGKNVLAARQPLAESAAAAGMSAAQAATLHESALARMRNLRQSQRAPAIGTASYANYNGLAAAALLRAGRALDLPQVRDLALESLEQTWTACYTKDRGIRRGPEFADANLRLLTDQAGLAYGLLAAFEDTGDIQYYNRAREIMDWTWTFLRDPKHGGLYDRLARDGDQDILRTLPWKPIEDLRYPAGNSLAAYVYDRLYAFSKDKEQKKRAETILNALSQRAVKQGPRAAWFGLALAQHLKDPTFVVILGDPAHETVRAMARQSLGEFDPDRIVMVLDAGDEAARELIGGYPRRGDAVAYVCVGDRCSRPLDTAQNLASTIRDFSAPRAADPFSLGDL